MLSDEGVALARSLGDPVLLSRLIGVRGVALANLGRDARPAFEEELDLSRQSGHRGRIAAALSRIGNFEGAAGDLQAARTRFEQALEIYRELGEPHEAAAVSINLGLVHYLEDDRQGAARLFTDALTAVG
jgi:tetratricopeptide (TPR) repeat protein